MRIFWKIFDDLVSEKYSWNFNTPSANCMGACTEKIKNFKGLKGFEVLNRINCVRREK